MIDTLQPYPEYKDSGSPWIGKIPAHWQLPRLGSVLYERGEVNETGQIIQVLSVLKDVGVIPYEEKGNIGNKKSENIMRYKVVRPDDIVVNCMNVIIGSVGISRYTGCLSPVYYVLKRRFEDDNPRYLNAVFQTKPFQKSLVRIGNGILAHRMRIPMELLKCEPFPKPTRAEQDAIVHFLDHATRQIDRYIRAKKRMIALLNEQKQVIIHQAVTRGLDPNVPLKPSGIPWLGDIPAHWNTPPLKSVCQIQSGVTLGKNYVGGNLIEYPYLRVANVQAGRLDLHSVKTLRLPKSEAQRSLLHPGDVLMTEGGDPDKLGRGYVWEGQIDFCLHQNHVFAVRPNLQKLRPFFLSALLGSSHAKNYFLRTAKQTTNLASTNKTTIGQFRILLPSIQEQDSILQQLELDTKATTEAITTTEREIALMREYRTRLIADVVTGQLDVLAAAAQLPAIVDTPTIEEIIDSEEDELEETDTESEEVET